MIRKTENHKAHRIREFIEKKIQEVQNQLDKTSDVMERLKLAITEASYAHILNQFFQNKGYTFEALMRLARAYIGTQNYEQALVQARLASKEADQSSNPNKKKATMIIAECKIKQNKFDDACQILNSFKLPIEDQQCQRNYYELLISALVHIGQEKKVYETLEQFKEFTLTSKGEKSTEYGFFLVNKGKCLGKFEKYEQGLTFLRQGVDILIEKKSKEKKRIAQIYLTMAEYYRNQNQLDKQYSSLICAQSMARQLQDSEKSILPIIHAIATNLIDREQFNDALKELKRAKDLQKELYGESSSQTGKTTKKILDLYNRLNLKSQAKKCEQEYSRIMATSGQSMLKQKIINYQIKNSA